MSAIEKPEVLEPDQIPSEQEEIRVGDWYWVRADASSRDDEDVDGVDPVPGLPEAPDESGVRRGRWFGCVVRIGSNYAELRGVAGRHGSYRCERIHLDEFDKTCTRERRPEAVISANVDKARAAVAENLQKVKQLTSSLGIVPSHALGTGRDTAALAVRMSDQPADDYKRSLVLAKDKQLPALFEKVKLANESMAAWMAAETIPLAAQAEGLKDVLGAVNDRIFNVELYAGLSEEAVRVRDGAPAGMHEKVRLFQRMHYMDEECLANYRTGGMSFANLGGFDSWLAEDENRDRLLPFPRCVVAFRVRRSPKDRRAPSSLTEFISFQQAYGLDKLTFLYVRNGDQVFRIKTGMEFKEKVFPDVENFSLEGKLWYDNFHDELITDDQYRGRVLEYQRDMREWRREERERKAAKKRGEEVNELSGKWGVFGPEDPARWFRRFDDSNVEKDDIAKKIQARIQEHNRVVVILQGLLDRSPMLHPHPPWQIWSPGGFADAVELVLDDSRSLVPGDAPDFEAYRAGLNASIGPGTVTVGQERAWLRREANRESARMDRSWRVSRDSPRPTLWKPYGNPGPGRLARVVKVVGDKCRFDWQRERESRGWDSKSSTINDTIAVPRSRLLNADAYRPGDFKRFFNDPRTRADYLRWAPMLLEAEEYHAGNRTVGPDPENRFCGDCSYREDDSED